MAAGTFTIRESVQSLSNNVPVTNLSGAKSSVANFRVSYLGAGPATRTLNQNFLGRVMNRIWPF